MIQTSIIKPELVMMMITQCMQYIIYILLTIWRKALISIGQLISWHIAYIFISQQNSDCKLALNWECSTLSL